MLYFILYWLVISILIYFMYEYVLGIDTKNTSCVWVKSILWTLALPLTLILGILSEHNNYDKF